MKRQVHPVQLSLKFELPLIPPPADTVACVPLSAQSNVVCFQAYRDIQQQPAALQSHQSDQSDKDPPRLYRGILDSIRHFAY